MADILNFCLMAALVGQACLPLTPQGMLTGHLLEGLSHLHVQIVSLQPNNQRSASGI